jgi:hypothetical protein
VVVLELQQQMRLLDYLILVEVVVEVFQQARWLPVLEVLALSFFAGILQQ